jgi:hypothetical protein
MADLSGLFGAVERGGGKNLIAVVKSAPVDGKVTVRFEGDEVDSGGGFMVASGLTVTTNDRVLMIPAGTSGTNYVVGLKLPA